MGQKLPNWMKVGGVGQLKATLAEVVIVVLIVIFARVVVEAEGKFDWSMLVLPVLDLSHRGGAAHDRLGGVKGPKSSRSIIR